MSVKKLGLAVAAAAAVGAFVLGGTALADATAESSPAPGVSGAPHGGPGGGHFRGDHTAVTGDELAEVTAAVQAKYSAVTVERAFKGPDGSYLVLGARADERTLLEVSADLATITERPRGFGRGHRGGPGAAHAAVAGDELAKVTAAVRGKDSAVTVERVVKAPDGSYRALGTKAGEHVRYRVSADLAIVTEGPTGRFGRGDHRPVPVPSTTS